MPKQLKLESDFNRYITFSQPINIFLQGEKIGSNVLIESHNDETLTDESGTHYVKSACVFMSVR
ncbi:hypothetical protein [Paenibacillus sp. Root444D2]|uniref:hypothetical protein n=1 Tax=Paenibacillus sp. Root444D2 TaxID=1736538 RepID=UPI00070E8E68|nr:hypothetical protein [Paenibacillus sp. Root444D2]KQX69245.1 hypothetical protein ASD40_01725 [Paenibacillus sp. Root444D2]